ncbi:MAG: hypothetical protein ABRQ25_04840 [Clostridiaceae bacterium]
MIKKQWDKPELFNIGVEATEAGGKEITTHDGKTYMVNNVMVEEYRS